MQTTEKIIEQIKVILEQQTVALKSHIDKVNREQRADWATILTELKEKQEETLEHFLACLVALAHLLTNQETTYLSRKMRRYGSTSRNNRISGRTAIPSLIKSVI